jgi:hypothetical protein
MCYILDPVLSNITYRVDEITLDLVLTMRRDGSHGIMRLRPLLLPQTKGRRHSRDHALFYEAAAHENDLEEEKEEEANGVVSSDYVVQRDRRKDRSSWLD